MTLLAWLMTTAYTAADIARCESSHAWNDAAVVLQVVRNRAARTGRTLLEEMWAPRQFARGCPTESRPWHPRHLLLAWQAMTNTLPVPEWARRARHYTGPNDRQMMCPRWRVQPLGTIVHTFCG